MDKKSFKKKHSIMKNDSSQEQLELLDEKYRRIKEILKEVLKDLKHEKEKREVLQKECSMLDAEVKEKENLLKRMQSVSEAVVDEFSALKVKCEMETEAANNAIKRASRYFQENQKLKNNTNLDLPVIVKTDETNDQSEVLSCENETELEILTKLNQNLRTEIACLKTQLNKEIEKQTIYKEDFEIAKKLFEQELIEHKCTAEKLKSFELPNDSTVQISESKSKSEDKNHERAAIIQTGEINTDSLTDNQSKTEKVAEQDLIATLAIVEKQKNELQNRVKQLEQQISNVKLNEYFAEPLYVPPPPPPPPPPPLFNPIKSFITFMNANKKFSKKTSSTPKEGVENKHQQAMSEMINSIKKGNIQLKPVPKNNVKKEDTSEPISLIEMRNILETLKKKENLKNLKTDETSKQQLSCCPNESVTSTNFGLNHSADYNKVSVADSIQRNSNKLSNDGEEKFHIHFQKSLTNHLNEAPLLRISDPNGNEFQYLDIFSCDSKMLEDEKDEDIMII